MQVLYDNGFGESCGLVIFALVGAMVFAGAVISAIFWLLRGAYPAIRPYVWAPAGLGVVVGIGVAGLMWFHDESLMGVAMDGAMLQHRYCQGPNYHVKSYPLAEITQKSYRRREQYVQSTGKTRVFHYIDVTIPSRGKPLSIPVTDPDPATLEALERFAPLAMGRYRLSLKTPVR